MTGLGVEGPAVVLALAFCPELESRAAVPVALLAYHMSVPAALAWTLVGNLAGAAASWWVLPPLASLARRVRWVGRVLDRVLEHTRRRALGSRQRLEQTALLLFVGIPLPGTGVWAGAAAAKLFSMPGRRAAWPLVGGTVMAAVLVTILVETGRLVL